MTRTGYEIYIDSYPGRYQAVSQARADEIIAALETVLKPNIFGGITIFPPETYNNGQWYEWHRRAAELGGVR